MFNSIATLCCLLLLMFIIMLEHPQGSERGAMGSKTPPAC